APAAPAWSQAAPPPPPPPAASQYGAPPQYPAGQYPPQYPAGQYPPQYPAGQYPPQYAQPPYAAAPAVAPAKAATGTSPLGVLLALAGGLIAIGAAWLPWVTQSGVAFNGIQATDTSVLYCGYYLIAGGAIAAVCGLLLMMRVGRGSGLHMLLAIGAIVGGIVVVAVEVSAYGYVNDLITGASGFGVDSGYAIGYGLYAGIGAGIAAALGGVLSLLGRR
ncbi:MAG: hypothetical protein ACHQ01_07735, partial [Candidatus Limnocylindrales bacterium]